MRALLAVVATSLVLTLAADCPAQDVLKVAPDHFKVLFENEHVRIVQNTLAPGEKDPIHTHPSGWYYVISPGKMKVTFPDGQTAMWESEAGEGSWLKTKSPHSDENVGSTMLIWVLVEVKSAEPNAPPPVKPPATKQQPGK